LSTFLQPLFASSERFLFAARCRHGEQTTYQFVAYPRCVQRDLLVPRKLRFCRVLIGSFAELIKCL